MKIHNITSSTLIKGGFTSLIGYSFKATSDAEIVFKNGDDASAPGVVYLLLGDDQSVRDEFIKPIEFSEGLYVHVISGSVVGAAWVA